MKGARTAVSVLICVTLLLGAAFLAADRGDGARAYGVTISTLESGGSLLEAPRLVPASVPAIAAFGLEIDGAAVAAPAALHGELGTIVFERSPAAAEDAFLTFGAERMPVPPGARVTIEDATGAAEATLADPIPRLAFTGSAKRVTIEPPVGEAVTTSSLAEDLAVAIDGLGLPVRSITLDGVNVTDPSSNVGRFDEIVLVPALPAEHEGGPLHDALQGDELSTEQSQTVGVAGNGTATNGPVDAAPVVRIFDAYVIVTVGHDHGVLYVQLEGLVRAILLPGSGVTTLTEIDIGSTSGGRQGILIDRPVNIHPHADFVWTEPVQVGVIIQFTDRSTDDTSALVGLHLKWEFCDGTILETALEAELVPGVPDPNRHPRWIPTDLSGTCAVVLTATDKLGLSDSIEKLLVVHGNAPVLGTITITPNPTDRTRTTWLNASVSDPDSEDITIEWDLGDGTVLVGASVSHRFTATGVFTIHVTASDPGGEFDDELAIVTVLDLPPVARFTASPGEVLTGEPVTLTDESFDPDASPGTEPGIKSRTWTVADFPAATGSQVTYTFTRPGTYPVALTVTDFADQSDSETGSLVVGNRPPVLTASADKTQVELNEDVTFTATYLDPDGPAGQQGAPPDGFRWYDNDALVGEGQTITRAFSEGGTHTMRVEATDADGATGTAEVLVFTDRPPVPSFTADPGTAFLSGTTLTLTDTSTDPDDGDFVAARSWSWAHDGTVSTDAVHTRTLARPGERLVTLTVEDQHGASASIVVPVSVQNRGPSVDIVSGPTLVSSGEEVTFVADAADPDGNVTALDWLVDGAPRGSGTSFTTSFTGGTHTVLARATDEMGATASDSQEVSVNGQPALSIVANPRNAAVNQIIQFTGAVTDPDGDEVAPIDWDFGDGSTGSGDSVQHSYALGGTYIVTATASDSRGAIGTATTSIVVLPPPLGVTIIVAHAGDKPVTDEPVTFTAQLTAGHAVKEARWVFGDGSVVVTSEASVAHTFTVSDSYLVTATVTSHVDSARSAAILLEVWSSLPVQVALTLELPDGQPFQVTAPAIGYGLHLPRVGGLVPAVPTSFELAGSTVTFEVPALLWVGGDVAQLHVQMGAVLQQVSVTLETSTLLTKTQRLTTVPTRVATIGLEASDTGVVTVAGDPVYGDPRHMIQAEATLVWFEGTAARNQLLPISVTYTVPSLAQPDEADHPVTLTYHRFFVTTDATGKATFFVPMPLGQRDPAPQSADLLAPTVDEPLAVLESLGITGVAYAPGRYVVQAGPTEVIGSTAASARFFVDVGTTFSTNGFK